MCPFSAHRTPLVGMKAQGGTPKENLSEVSSDSTHCEVEVMI